MNTLSHKSIALYVAFFAAMLVLAALVVMRIYILPENDLLYSVFIALVIFTVMFAIAFFIIRKYIVQKITPLYHTFLSVKSSPYIKSINNTIIEDVNILDITEKEVAEWARAKNVEIDELHRLAQYRKEYIGNVAHELKTPIFTLQSYISTLLDGGLHDEAVAMKYLQKADNSIQRMATIVQDLDTITKLEVGELRLEYSEFEIKELLYEVIESLEMLAAERGVTIYATDEACGNYNVWADRKHIAIVLTNLITNAIKYNRPRKGRVKIIFHEIDKHILIEVEDSGIGIYKTDAHRIFERFYRVEKSRSREMGGTGLGLAIVKHIVEAHLQTIHVKSKPGEGSSFIFSLPLTQEQANV